MTTGDLDEAVFKVDRPDLANAVWYLLQVSQSPEAARLRRYVLSTLQSDPLILNPLRFA